VVYPFLQSRLCLFLILLGLSCPSVFANSASKLIQPARTYPTFVLHLELVTAGDSEVRPA
jgi:hypothetical protein